jgi:hemerythrin
MAFVWNPDLSVGIEKIDNQHKKLFEIVDQLTEACNERRGKEEVGNVLNFLKGYVVEHFRDEEGVMLQYKYPKFLAHKQIHVDFTKTVEDLCQKYNTEGVGLAVLLQTNKTVYAWLKSHIFEMDKEFGAFAKK